MSASGQQRTGRDDAGRDCCPRCHRIQRSTGVQRADQGHASCQMGDGEAPRRKATAPEASQARREGVSSQREVRIAWPFIAEVGAGDVHWLLFPPSSVANADPSSSSWIMVDSCPLGSGFGLLCPCLAVIDWPRGDDRAAHRLFHPSAHCRTRPPMSRAQLSCQSKSCRGGS